ncbi:DinB family protein [uncultured Winogradskyella sp.]|uniref:DinB family protein n=1 Tax=uncultured Winogradskyella sp. TaxID=395353 RepID=UPI0030D78656|tara:strand:+ start:87773 stop:88243 length:471 start_codon:yes stop_codon:yes gene_type:complete
MKPANIKVLENELDHIERFIPQSESINTSISKTNVAWHLEHSLKVINAVIATMQKSDPALYIDNFSFLGKILLTLKFFPRGKAKAPKHVLPSNTILVEDIKTQLAEARQNIKSITGLDKNAYFKHPLFGNVNTFRVIRFLDAHTNHHLKIVKSILN